MKNKINNFSIITNLKSISNTKSGALIGKISMQFPFGAFPDSEWLDFIIIMEHWISVLKNMNEGNIKKSHLCFMEGPFRVAITSHRKGIYSLNPKNYSNPTLQWPIVEMDKCVLFDIIKNSIKDVVEYCSKSKISSNDLERLKESLKES